MGFPKFTTGFKKKSTPTHEEQKYTREEIQMSQGDVDMPQHGKHELRHFLTCLCEAIISRVQDSEESLALFQRSGVLASSSVASLWREKKTAPGKGSYTLSHVLFADILTTKALAPGRVCAVQCSPSPLSPVACHNLSLGALEA